MSSSIVTVRRREREVSFAGVVSVIGRTVLRIVVYAILVAWACVAILPIYWMLTTSIKAATTLMIMPPQWIPRPVSWEHYQRIFEIDAFPRWVFNTAFVSTVVTIGSTLNSAMCAYAFAKLDFPGRNSIFWFLLSLIMVPYAVVWVPLFIMVSKLGLINTYIILIVPGLASVWNMFLLKQFIQTLPSSLIDCARIDACTEFGIFRKIILPLAKPGLAVVAIFTFIGQWNSFFWWLLFTNTRFMRNLSVGLAQYRYQYSTDYGPLMAGASISAIPVIIIFLLFQRYFLRGLTVGALKG